MCQERQQGRSCIQLGPNPAWRRLVCHRRPKGAPFFPQPTCMCVLESGQILADIDVCGLQVLGWDVERVKPLILGPVGSQITMSFQRVGNQVAGKRSIDVVMIRQLVDP